MSISSCRLDCGPYYADVTRKKYVVEIEFLNNPNYQQYTAGISSNSITIQDGVGYLTGDNIAVANQYAGTISSTNEFKCLGYRFFFHKGYLKCLKKEIAMYNYVVTSGTSISIGQPTIPRKMVRESFYHPFAVWDSIQNFECRRIIQEEVIELARTFGIKVPKHFARDGEEIYEGTTRSYYFAAFDWLTYPLVREIDSPTLARNTIHMDRNMIAPKFDPMNFKQLVEHYYGTSTTKMLAEIWKVVTVGHDYRKQVFPDPAIVNGNIDLKKEFLSRQDHGTVLRVMENEVWMMGDRHLQTLIFTLGPSILKSMGFDYFYQAIPKLNVNTKSRMHEGYAENIALSPRTNSIVGDISVILKSVSPKKLLSVLLPDKSAPDLHSLRDTANMLREYDSHERIPKSLKLQYPTGLIVDFKFKTMKELHDKISTQYTIIKAEASKKEIPVAEVYMKLDGMEKNGLRLVVPTNTTMLSLWGKALNICIASYGDNAARGGTLLLGVEKDSAIKYCIEFDEISIRRVKPLENIGAFVTTENFVPTPDMTNVIEETYPLLREHHAGVTPTDTPPEDETFHMPSIVQFRGMRNGSPDKDDKIAVEVMLANWVKENFEFLSSIKGIFDLNKRDNYEYAVQHAIDNVGQADQLIMNPRDYENLQRALAPQNGHVVQVDGNGNIPLAVGNAINIVVDHHVPNDQLWAVNRLGQREVMINNIGVGDVI